MGPSGKGVYLSAKEVSHCEPSLPALPVVELCVSDGVAGRASLAVPQAIEWQHIRNCIDAAMIFAQADFVKVHRVVALFSAAR